MSHKNNHETLRPQYVDLLSSFLLAFLWVRYYGYRYNIPFLNSPFVNWWALTIWTLGLYGVLYFHKLYIKMGWKELPAAGLIWVTCLAVTLIIEFIGYKVLGVREMGGHPPLVFDLVHGTAVLKICYFFAAPIAVGGAALVKKILFGRRLCETNILLRQKRYKSAMNIDKGC